MTHCTDCYGTNTILPCANVGCIDVNYSKCILYSGDNLYCALGAVGNFSFTGVAVVPGSDTTVTLPASNVSGTGTGITFEVTRTAGSNSYIVKLANSGSGYAVGNQVKILGTALGGTTPANDLVLTITELAAVIPNGSNLDAIIELFHNSLCSGVSAGGIDYTTMSYSCLRQSGVLTGIGSAITTEKQFVESASAALCAINTSLNAYDTTLPISSFTNVGSLPGVSAPYTLNEVLGGVGTAIANINSGLNYGSITANPCVAYSFTAKPSTSVVADYFNWITTNMCGMYGTLNGNITSVTTLANSLKTYISGGSSVPASVDTSTLPGGSSTSTASSAINLLISQVAGINGVLSSVPSANYSLTWASCFGGSYPTNSVFKTQTWNYTNTATTLQNQLDRIVTVLSSLNLKFDATQFTITAGACGASIALASGIAFTPASLNAAVLNDLGDVNNTGLSNGDVLTYDTGVWKNKALTVKVNGSTVPVTKTVATSEITFDIALTDNTPVIYPLVANNTAEYTVSTATRFPLGTQAFPFGTKHGGMVTLQGVLQMTPVGAGLSWTHLGSKIIATLPVAIRPSNPVYFNAELYVKVGATYSNSYTRATGIIDTAGNLTLSLMNPSGSLVLTTSDLIEVVIGGVSYAI